MKGIQGMEVFTGSNSSPMSMEEDIRFEGLGGGDDTSDGHSNSGSESNSSSGSGRTGSTSDKGDHLFGRDGLLALAGARGCVIITLLVAAAIMAAVVFVSLKNNQTSDFISEVRGKTSLLTGSTPTSLNGLFRSL